MNHSSPQIQESFKFSSFLQYLTVSLIWPQNIPTYIQYFFFWISNFQIIIVLLWTQLKYIAITEEKDHLFEAIFDTSQILAIDDWIKSLTTEASKEILILVTWGYLTVLLISIILCCVKFILRLKILKNLNYLLFYLAQIHLSLAFWGISLGLFATISSSLDQIDKISNYYSVEAIAKKIISLILVIINFTISLFFSAFSYDPCRSSNIISTHTPIFQILTFILKGSQVMIIGIYDSSNRTLFIWLFVMSSFCIIAIRHYYLIRTFPFYHYSPQQLSIIMSSISLFLASSNLLVWSLRGAILVSGTFVLYFQLLMIPFLVKYSKIYIKNVTEAFFCKDAFRIFTETEAIKKVFSLSHFIKNVTFSMDSTRKKFSFYELYLWVGISPFLEKEADLFSSARLSDNSSPPRPHQICNLYAELMNDVVHKLYLALIKQLPNNRKLKFLFGNYLLERNINLASAVYYIAEVSKRRGFLVTPAARLLQDIEKIVQNSFASNEEGILNLKVFVEFDTAADCFVKLIHENIVKFTSFWETYLKPKFAITDLIEKSTSVETNDKTIRLVWARHIEKEKIFANSMKSLYMTYLLLIRNAPFSAFLVKEKYKSHDLYKDQKDQEDDIPLCSENVMSPENIIVTASMASGQIGKVLHVSNNVTKYLGWNYYDILGKNANILLMPFLRDKHTQIMTKRLDTSKIFGVYRRFNSFILTKMDDITPCSIYFSIHPYVQEGLKYTALIRIKKVNQDIMILSENGYLEGFTKNLRIQLNLTYNKKFHIMDIYKDTHESSNLGLCKLPLHDLHSTPKILGAKESWKMKFAKKILWFDMENGQREKFAIQLMSRDSSQSIKSYSAKLECEKMDDLMFYVMTLQSKSGVETNAESYHRITFNEDEQEDRPKIECEEMDFIPNERVTYNYNTTTTGPMLRQDHSRLFMNKVDTLSQTDPIFSPQATVEKSSNKTYLHAENRIDENSGRLKKKLEKKAPKKEGIMKDMMEADTAISSYYSSETSMSSRIEEAVYLIPQHKKVRIFSILVLVLICLSSTSLIFLQGKNQQNKHTVEDITKIISSSVNQLLTLIELNRLMKLVANCDAGLFKTDRYVWANIPDVRFIVDIRVALETDKLTQEIIFTRNLLHVLPKNTNERLYRKVSVVEWDPNSKNSSMRLANPLDILTDIIAAEKKFSSLSYLDMTINNQDGAFILNNTMGDLLFTLEDVANMAFDDIKSNISDISDAMIILMLLVGVMCFIFIGSMVFIEREFIRDRNRLLEIFLRFDDHEIQNFLKIVFKFRSALEKNNMDGRNMHFEDRTDQLLESTGKGALYKKRSVNKQYINLNMIKIAVWSLFLVTLFLLGYGIVFMTIKFQNRSITAKTEMLINNNFNLYELGIAYVGLYDYIASNGTSKLRGNPITEEWERTFMKFSNLQEKLIKFTDNQEGGEVDSKLVEIIKGNLCDVLVSDPYAGAQCASLIYGMVSKGIVQLNNFMVALLQRIKQSFYNSARTYDDMFRALSDRDLVQTEGVWALYMLPGYQAIDQLIREQLENDISNYSKIISITTTTCAGIFIILGILLWYKIKKTFEVEGAKWRKLMRLVPQNIIKRNKMIKMYLFGRCKFEQS